MALNIERSVALNDQGLNRLPFAAAGVAAATGGHSLADVAGRVSQLLRFRASADAS